MIDRYRLTNIRKGFYHFVGGKALTAVTGVATLLLVVRALPVDQYAAYAVLSAFIMIFSALSGLGLAQIGQRYIPELGEQGNYAVLRRLIGWVVWSRWLVVLFALGLTYWAASPIAEFFKLLPWLGAFEFYLAVVFFRVAGLHVFQILESMLHQGAAQLGILSASVLKLSLVGYFYFQKELSLNHVLWSDLAGDLLGFLILTAGLVYAMKGIVPHDKNTSSIIKLNQLIRFGITGYLRDLAYLLYGSSANRLIASRTLLPDGVASVGFAQSLADIARRYIPVQLFQGMLRPVMMARYARGEGTGDLVKLVNFSFKLNFLILAIPIIALIIAGTPAISWLTQGKYHETANTLLIIFMIAIVGESLLILLDIVTQAIERNEITLIANLVLSSSIFFVFPLIPFFGAIAIALANLVGVLMAILIVLYGLKIYGVVYRHDWKGSALILLAAFIGALVGAVFLIWANLWPLAMLLSVLGYLIACWLFNPFKADEKNLLKKLLNRNPALGRDETLVSDAR